MFMFLFVFLIESSFLFKSFITMVYYVILDYNLTFYMVNDLSLTYLSVTTDSSVFFCVIIRFIGLEFLLFLFISLLDISTELCHYLSCWSYEVFIYSLLYLHLCYSTFVYFHYRFINSLNPSG